MSLSQRLSDFSGFSVFLYLPYLTLCPSTLSLLLNLSLSLSISPSLSLSLSSLFTPYFSLPPSISPFFTLSLSPLPHKVGSLTCVEIVW